MTSCRFGAISVKTILVSTGPRLAQLMKKQNKTVSAYISPIVFFLFCFVFVLTPIPVLHMRKMACGRGPNFCMRAHVHDTNRGLYVHLRQIENLKLC